MMKKNFFILILMPGLLKAQFVTDYLKAADSYYKKGDYYSAAQYYEKYLASKGTKAKPEDYNPYNVKPASGVKSAAPNAQLAVYNLAESYRQLNYPVKAVAYYEQALSYKNSQLPLALYYYAVTLRALANYEGAERAFQQYLDEYKIEDVYANSAKSEVLNLHFIREQLNRNDLTLYSEEKLGQQINPGGANYSPVWVNKNTLLFTSTRTEGDSSRNKPYLNRLYEAVYENGEVKSVNKIEIPQGAGIHQGVAAVSPDGKTMFLTRWSLAAGKKTSAIYTSKKLDSGWAEPVMFDALVNTPGYNAQQPFVMADGKTLLFSSDKPGGSGGFDLWYATLDANGKPGKAVNLGATINTVNDEQAPYYHDSSGTLVFSCNGRTGMGGFDFFFSKGSLEAWATPENFGYPVNSIKDDIYFTSRGGVKNILEDVLLSSDRSAECCLELFNLKKKDSIPNPVPVPDTEVVMEEPKVESVIVLENVYYDFDSSTLRVESYPALDKLVGLLNEYPTMVIEIRAHTDNKGNDKYNLNLSGARAKVVVDYLISKGIHKDRLQSKGYGASIPVAPNTHEDGSDDPDGRQKNRRTEFKVLSK